MFRGFFVGTDVQTCTTINVVQGINISALTGNSNVVDRTRVRWAETERFSVGTQSLLWFIAIRQRRTKPIPQEVVLRMGQC